MKAYFQQLDKAFESRVRLGIMSVLSVEETVDFNSLKDLLGTTDGNLASHLKALEQLEMIRVHKEFVKRKPRTTYRLTPAGRQAFNRHLQALEHMIREQK